MKRLGMAVLFLLLALPVVVSALQATPQFQCLFASGYGGEISPNHYVLDLQCQPALGFTLDIPTGQTRTFTVNLSNYLTATGRLTAEFNIHLAMDRARINVRQADSLQGTEVTDALAALRDLRIRTSQQSYTFVIENLGLRSAVFDLSVRPYDD